MSELILEILYSVLYDISEGDPTDGIEAIEEVILMIENKEG